MGYVKQHFADLIYDAAMEAYLNENAEGYSQGHIYDMMWEMWEILDPVIETSEEMVELYKEHKYD